MTADDSSVQETCSCDEYRASRRAFLGMAAGATAGAVGVTMFGDTFRQVAYGGSADTNVLVVLSMRGGADSLSIVVPHAERAYYATRPRIAVPRDRLVARDPAFGLHPSLRSLTGMWGDRRLAAVVATGLPVPNRSHFAAMEEVEDADPGSGERRGWINRMIGLDTEKVAHEAVSLGSGLVPTSMWGPTPTLSAREVDRMDMPGPSKAEFRRRKKHSLQQVWRPTQGPLARGVLTTLRAVDIMGDVARRPYRPANGARYPDGKLGDAMRDTARLIKARRGVEVVTIDHGGWDMHNNLGSVDASNNASMKGRLAELAGSLSAFFTDLGGGGNRVTAVTITEFGRRLVENGSGGLDHGWASAMLVLGAGVRGGRYYGRWPGLTAAALVDGDLAVTTDYRSVLSEVLRSRFNVSTPSVFPGFVPEPLGLML